MLEERSTLSVSLIVQSLYNQGTVTTTMGEFYKAVLTIIILPVLGFIPPLCARYHQDAV